MGEGYKWNIKEAREEFWVNEAIREKDTKKGKGTKVLAKFRSWKKGKI